MLRIAIPLSFAASLIFLSGCSRLPSAAVSPLLQGTVHGGQQPVSGAAVQLYAVGKTGDGSAATPLLASPVLTDSGGNFTLTGAFTCPSALSLLYLTATGGNPGLPAGSSNPQLVELAPLGPCYQYSSTSNIVLNEVTTVAAVYALAPFISSPTGIGSASSDSSSLANAFTVAAELVNVANGSAPGTSVPAGVVVPAAQINTIADILATCINTAGGVAGDRSPCGNFLSLTTPSGTSAPADAASALLNLARNPTLNTAALYKLLLSAPPFQPLDTSQPADLSIQLSSSTLNSTSVTVTSPLAVVPFGQATFTATLANPAATGTISFLLINGQYLNSLGTVAVSNGSAAVNGYFLPAASYQVVAQYSGDSSFSTASSAPFPIIIEAAATSTTLAAASSNSFTATVAGLTPTGNAQPTGSVYFYDSPTVTSNPHFYPALIGFGDSIMTGAVASPAADGFFDLVLQDFPANTSGSHALGGDQAADLAVKVFLNTSLAAVTAGDNPVTLMEDGANDFLFCDATGTALSGTPGCLNNYSAANLAAATWLTIPQVVPNGANPYTTKIAGQSCTPSGTWANSASSYVSTLALASSTLGSTLTCAITSTGGPIYIAYEAADSSAGNMSVSIDGTPAATLNAFGFNGQTIATANGATSTIFADRLPVAAGNHTVVFTVTSPTAAANVNSVVAVMTPPPAGLLANPPYLVIMGVLRAYAGAYDTISSAFNSSALSLANQLHSDGLNVAFADTRDALDPNVDMASYAAGVHPNNAGHLLMAQTLYPLVQPGAGAAVIVGSAPLSGVTAQITLTGLAAGTHNIVAVYEGDQNFANSSSAVQVVQTHTAKSPDVH